MAATRFNVGSLKRLSSSLSCLCRPKPSPLSPCKPLHTSCHRNSSMPGAYQQVRHYSASLEATLNEYQHPDGEAMVGDHELTEQEFFEESRASLKLPQLQPQDRCIGLKAFYMSRSVDLKSLSEEELIESISYTRSILVARFKDKTKEPSNSSELHGWTAMSHGSSMIERIIVAFHYGSIVLLNFGNQDEEQILNLAKKYCADPIEETRKDDYRLVVRPSLDKWSWGCNDTMFLKKLDLDNVRIVSSVLAQSVALEHHIKKADKMVTVFSFLNRTMEKTGSFTMSRRELFQLVAAANTTLADLVLRVRFLDRSEAAWKDARYADIWEYLRAEFEFIDRFESMNFKLRTLQSNLNFFLDVLQNRKSDFNEWLIIILISFELSVSLYFILHEYSVL